MRNQTATVDPAVATRGELHLGGDNPKQRETGGLCLNTLPDDAPLSQIIARLNDVMLALKFVFRDGVVDRDTLAMVARKTSAMRGPNWRAPKQLEKAKEPSFGQHPDEHRAMEYLRDYVRGWREGQPYLVLSTVTDHMMSKGYRGRKGRPFNQSQIATLIKSGGKYGGRFD